MLSVKSEESTNISRVHLVPKVLSCSILTLRCWFGLMQGRTQEIFSRGAVDAGTLIVK